MDSKIEKDLEYFRDYIFPDLATGVRLYKPGVEGPVTADHCVGSIAGVYKGFGVYYLVHLKDGSESWMPAEQLHRTYCCGH